MPRHRSDKSPLLPTDLPDKAIAQAISRALLRWFLRHARDLPWRGDRDPYKIWVSEIMLQQTQVVTVVPYFERFLKTFPTLKHLAQADEQDVLRLWEGLGYYRRARDLHKAARLIASQHNGTFPPEPAIVAELPGIGRYMLGAILSQAFDARLPIVEANSQRVLCRLFARRDDPRQVAERRWLWAAAEALLPTRGVGDFNQALMELGALVCTPQSPKCASCPLARFCAARLLGLQEELPVPAERPNTVECREAAIVLRRGSKLLVVQRPATGRWANLWEFPHGAIVDGEAPSEAAQRLLQDLTGFQGKVGGQLLTIKHAVTHHKITLVCFEAALQKGRFVSDFYQQVRWIEPDALKGLPVSSPQRRVAQFLTHPG